MFTSLFIRRCCCCRISNGWRSFATRTDLVLPWLMLSSPCNPETRYFFDIVGDGTLELNREIHLPQISSSFCIGSSEGFLFTVPTRQSPDAIPAVNPLNPREDRLLLPTLPDVVVRAQDREHFSPYLSKIVLSPSRDVAILLRNGMAEYARLSPLASLSSWMPLQTHHDPSPPSSLAILNDCIFHKGRLHVSNHDGRVAIIDMDDPSVPPLFYSDAPRTMNQDKFEFHWCFRRSLVESPDGKDLFLLTRFSLSQKTFLFEVFKLGDDNSWNQVGSIGKLVFFVGPNMSVAMSAVDFPNLEPNSIYFTDGYMVEYRVLSNKYVGDTGVFSLDDGSVRFFNLIHGHRELNWPQPEWFMPSTL